MTNRAGIAWALAFARESVRSARSQPVASLVTVVMLAGMCAAVLLTSGRTVGERQQVLASIDQQGSRLVVVTEHDPSADLDTRTLRDLDGVDGVAWSAGFSAAHDMRNAAVPEGPPVPVRVGYGTVGSTSLTRQGPAGVRAALATAQAQRLAGFADGVGALSGGGQEVDVVGRIDVPDYLSFLQPLTVVPAGDSGTPAPLHTVIVVATSPSLVEPVAQVVRSLLPTQDPNKISVQTSEQIANVRAVVAGHLDDYNRQLLIAVVILAGALVAANLFGLVAARRKDFGRRRALGASRGLIVGLLLTQVLVLAVVSAAVGTTVSLLTLHDAGDPLPPPDFAAAVAVLALAAGLLGGLVPAIVAARRDPLRELRVP